MSLCCSDVIELSSGDEGDALRISSEEDEERSLTPGTEESSGSHVNDSLNQPDGQGRVLVNINHPAEEEDLFLAPQLARAVKPHQVLPFTPTPHYISHVENTAKNEYSSYVDLKHVDQITCYLKRLNDFMASFLKICSNFYDISVFKVRLFLDLEQ